MSSKGVVLITGCSSGFGFRTALTFARHGYTTYASVRDMHSEGTRKLQEIAIPERLPLGVVELDVSRDESVKKAVAAVAKKEKQIDILVNNAGWGYRGPIEEYEIEEIVNLYQTNVFGMLRMVKAVAPIMRKHKKGLIINMSSINGLIPFPMMGIYSSSKYAIETLTEVLRFELSHFGISVTQIEPGAFLTEGNGRNFKWSTQLETGNSVYASVSHRFKNRMEAAREKASKNWLLRRLLDPQRVADLILAISQDGNPRMRYRIGLDAHVYYAAKKFLPESLWEWILHQVYQW